MLDLEPVYWSAYSAAAGALGLPRPDRATYWRLQRTGPDATAFLRGARPQQLREFVTRFAELLEADASWESAAVRDGLQGTLVSLRSGAELILVTLGSNRAVRQRVLDAGDLSVHFMRMSALGGAAARERQLRELAGEARRVMVAVASEELVRAARDAELVTIGVSNGACVGQRLTRAGAGHVYPSLDALNDAIATSADELARAGLIPRRA